MFFFKSKPKNALTDAQQKYQNTIYRNFNEYKNSPELISYESFINQWLLESNYTKNDPIVVELLEQIKDYLASKNELRFQSFVISFDRNLSFSLENLVPCIKAEVNSNLKTLNLSLSDNPNKNYLLKNLNHLLNSLLLKKLAVEIYPNLIVTYNQEINKYSLFFGKEFN
ncbi:MSC_0623 family F1-like ATPase-associated protein [Mycoplasmopsis gallopavonis]|uniref:Protein of uncharacterized function (DUF2714) n=1 Tax=Mycoplasmopsis gallopavonis TaxID=76629 RepID=A0A449B0H0_9BACT|nr:DUF2714 domain-containing protein [Mycoplasmopsis gallopavonis]RIV16313.1 DUF2714 domain-containing protein [Mycoplasmopsis gallopavonis]VEU73236.1 Protein of uncharacterised function (DUF2714) [Mycoplasmopsis gallopavonis]